MKATKFTEDLRTMSAEELNAKLKELKSELFSSHLSDIFCFHCLYLLSFPS